ncbi:hypothetical protein R6V09_25325 [Streptomyces sp. W16]|uniref:hypothetical protein n=1 Tax=Streptomyces sp. W16 TaxID=3076631 RepID=UPI00295B0E3E|nr:hypothetical protein [Streptomyces sp. W16]MDV9173411.1 hypothetical protein [Streptomyces sp. W16]
MSRISRRSLLEYSGTTAVGAMVGAAAAAQPAQAAEAATDTTPADFPAGTLFTGTASLINSDESPQLTIKFSVAASETPPTPNGITATDIADLLNDFAASRGWPSITFYGTPAPAPLN